MNKFFKAEPQTYIPSVAPFKANQIKRIELTAVLHIQGKKSEEIQDILGISASTVSKHLSDARFLFGEEFEHLTQNQIRWEQAIMRLQAKQTNPNVEKKIIRWANQPRSEEECEKIEEELIESNDHSVGSLTKQFAVLLKYALEEAGYDFNDTDSYHHIGTHIGLGQKPERTLPYDPLLVKAWFSGEVLPTRDAWEGARHWLRETDSVPDYYRRTMDAVFTAARAKIRQEHGHPKHESELQQTLKLRINEAGIAHGEIKEAFAQANELLSNKKKSYNNDAIDRILEGISKTHASHAWAIDELLRKHDITVEPSLSALYWQDKHQTAAIAWQNAVSFGPALQAIRRSLNMSRPQFGESIRQLSGSTIAGWEREHILTHCSGDTHNRECPSSDMLEDFIFPAIQREEAQLQKMYGDAFTPFLTEERKQELRTKRDTLGNGRTTVPSHHERRVYPEALQALATVLTQEEGLSYRMAGIAIGIASNDSMTKDIVDRIMKKARQRYGRDYSGLDGEEHAQARTEASILLKAPEVQKALKANEQDAQTHPWRLAESGPFKPDRVYLGVVECDALSEEQQKSGGRLT